ncbi:MAG: hypothetical protein JWM27_816 [Gemmatimonadetes bacterium]|nr:hypothetical protein [Gemmatimonadota bacterium]
MIPNRMRVAVQALALCVLAGACQTVRTTPPRRAPIPCDGACGDTVSVQFLGVAGFVIRHGGDAVLTGPLFTTPGLPRVALAGAFRSDTAFVRRRMTEMHVDTSGISAVLVGHAHYDHLLDVPYVARRFTPRARVYGNRAMVNQLPDADLQRRFFIVEDFAATQDGGGRWIYPKTDTLFRGPRPVSAADSSVRFLAVAAVHPAHLVKWIHAFGGGSEKRTVAPQTAFDWREGRVFAFVVEFLDPASRRVLFRVHFTDAPSWPGAGFPPRWVGGAGTYDLALTCVGTFDQVPGQDIPGSFLRYTWPRHVVLGHWEDFFVRQEKPWHAIPLLKVDEYRRRVVRTLGDSTAYTLPAPGDEVRLCGCTTGPGRPVPPQQAPTPPAPR